MRTHSWILCLALLAGAEARAAPPRDGAASVIRQDKRLRAALTLRVRDQPLSEFVADVGKRTGVRLRTTRLTGDDKVTLFVKDRPVGEVLARVAAHFDFQWTREGEVYELGQSLAAQNRERKLREADAAEQLQGLQTHMNRLQALLQTPRDRLEARQKELMAALRDPRAGGDRAALASEMQLMQELLSPGAAASLALFRQLNAPQLAQLTAAGQIRLSTETGTLSPALAEQIHLASAEMLKSGRVLRIGDGAGGAGANPESEPPTGATAVVSLEEGYQPPPGGRASLRRGLVLRFVLSSLRGEPGKRNVLPVIWGPRPGGSQAEPLAGATPTNDPELKQEVDLATTDGPPANPAEAGPVRPFLLPGGTVGAPGMTPLSRVLELLHDKTGLEILADSFVRTRIPQGDLPLKRPVVQLLDSVRDQLDYVWEKDGHLLTLRDRRFYRDRPEEIPARLARTWQEQLAKAGTLSLDDLAAIMAAISDPQARSLQSFWGWYLESPGVAPPDAPSGLYDNRFHLRFWATLTAPQRLTARQEILPVGRMHMGQRNAFALALASRSGLMARPDDQEKPVSAEELTAGGFTLKSGQSTLRSMSGLTASGARVAVRLQGDAARGDLPRIPGPEGGDVQFDNDKSTILDSYDFHYHVAANPRPIRVASIQVPRPATKAEQERK